LLFNRDIKTIGKHINNALKDELSGFSVVANFATTAADGKQYKVQHYNLDMVLSVGYRVKSNEGIKFRKWANSVLKEHIVDGYTINQNRLNQLNKAIEIISRTCSPSVSAIAQVLNLYSKGLDLLDQYDHQSIKKTNGKKKSKWKLTYEEGLKLIPAIRFSKESSLFGMKKDRSFESSISTMYQTFGGQELYPSIQAKAAILLYLIVKNHPFIDGNKRIAAVLFVYFLNKNDVLTDKNGIQIIDNNTLAAITLVIALSKPEEKDIMLALIMNILDMK
jgi:prophage maintenance system killer protein